jgi:chaperonin GroEL
LFIQIDNVKTQAANAISQLDRLLLEERVAKLAGGIARLKVIGSSNGETKEKRDRAEDAVCAVRGTIKNGCLPGGGWMLMNLANRMEKDPVLGPVLGKALVEPVRLLLENAGLNEEEILGILLKYIQTEPELVYDASDHVWVNPKDKGLLDSVPAVLEAIRNSISIAALLGTLGGSIAFDRDEALDRTEARDTANFLRDANVNPADERP